MNNKKLEAAQILMQIAEVHIEGMEATKAAADAAGAAGTALLEVAREFGRPTTGMLRAAHGFMAARVAITKEITSMFGRVAKAAPGMAAALRATQDEAGAVSHEDMVQVASAVSAAAAEVMADAQTELETAKADLESVKARVAEAPRNLRVVRDSGALSPDETARERAKNALS